ncbi:MAG TPA: hypothetical protein VN541_21180, partial [Tepidisphaeraceae bacterium]|nr:hypothetical protein [Tepidisphaeraceae bacterium]
MGSEPAIAYIAEGKLYLKQPGSSPRLLDSPFVQGILDRVSRDRQRNEWKSQGGAGWNFGRAMMPVPGQPPAEIRRVQYTGVSRGASAGELIYAIDTDHVGGLFGFEIAENSERRLFHRNQFRPRDLVRHPADGTLAFSLPQPDGSANIALLQPDGRGLREVTEGDSMDEAPSWVGNDRVLLFQSAGIGRDQRGLHRMYGPYAIQRLDLDRGDLITVAEDDAFDFLTPRMGADGWLYFIRRPYEPHGRGISPIKALLDVVLFPYRVARATVHFLNFFSLMFSRKPLLTAGGPPREGPDTRYMMLWGKVIDAEKILNASKSSGGAPLVPS